MTSSFRWLSDVGCTATKVANKATGSQGYNSQGKGQMLSGEPKGSDHALCMVRTFEAISKIILARYR